MNLLGVSIEEAKEMTETLAKTIMPLELKVLPEIAFQNTWNQNVLMYVEDMDIKESDIVQGFILCFFLLEVFSIQNKIVGHFSASCFQCSICFTFVPLVPPGQESEALQSANSLAREILLKQHADGHGQRVAPAFAAPSRRPHLSLIYGDHPQEERSKIVSWIKELSPRHGGHGHDGHDGVVTPSKQKHLRKQRCQRCWHANVQKWRVPSHTSSTKDTKAKS